MAPAFQLAALLNPARGWRPNMGQIQTELTNRRNSLHQEDMGADDSDDEKIVKKRKDGAQRRK